VLAEDTPRHRVRPLRHFQLMVTLQCPFACAHCCWNCHPGRGGLMPVADAVSYIEQALRLAPPPQNVTFTGGKRFGILDESLERGCHAQKEYASVCHLCWDLRRQLAAHFPEILQPATLYADDEHLASRARRLASGLPR
jgi:MoaA/NifB/PqqE/SkfB family radical SAM enzyme